MDYQDLNFKSYYEKTTSIWFIKKINYPQIGMTINSKNLLLKYMIIKEFPMLNHI